MSIFKKENGALVEYTNPLPADYVAPIEDGATSAHNYAVGAFALVKGVLRKITTAVTSGTAITNANSEITTVAEQLEEINTDLSAKGITTLYTNTGTTNPASITLSDSMSNYDLILFVAKYTHSGQSDSNILPASVVVNDPMVVISNDAMYVVYNISSDTTLTFSSASRNDYIISGVYGIKL